MDYPLMFGSPTINVQVYTHVGGSPKNKVKPFTPIGSWIVKHLTKIDEKCDYFLQNKLKIKYKIGHCNIYIHQTYT